MTFVIGGLFIDMSVAHAAGEFLATFRTTGANESITLPTYTGSHGWIHSYDYYVDWGDGSPVDHITAWNQVESTHIYAIAGDHQISITGSMPMWTFIGSTGREVSAAKLISIDDAGDVGFGVGITNFTAMFSGTSSLVTIPLIDTNLGTNLSYMFYDSGISSLPALDTSSAINFYAMFAYTPNLTTLPLLDTSNVTNFEWAFYDSKIETLPAWDVSAGTSFTGIFGLADSLTRVGFTGATRAIDYSEAPLNLYSIKRILSGVGTASGAQTITFNAAGDVDDLNLADYTAIQAKGWTLLPAFTSNCTQWDAANLSSFYYLQNANLPGSGAASSAKYYYDCDSFSFKYADAGGDLVAISTESARRGDTAAMTAVTTAGEDEAYYDEQANQFKVGQANGTLSNLSAPSRSLDAAGIAAVTGATEGEFYFNTTTAKFHIANVGGTLDVMFTAP